MSNTSLESRRLLFVLNQEARDKPDNRCKLLLSNGMTLEGNLSPYDDQSDYVRVNLDGGDLAYVALAHIVAVKGL